MPITIYLTRFWAFAALIILCGCAAPTSFDQYQQTIQQFQEATDKTSTVTLEFILDMNRFERRLELDRLRADPNRILDLPKNFVANRFDPEAIAIRVQAFEVIKSYTNLLATLAESDAGERWVSATEGLKGSVDRMASSSKSASQYTSALKELADFVGQALINAKRAKALDAAIKSAAPAINEISSLLKDDLQTVVLQRATIVNIPLITIAGEYQDIQAKAPTPAQEAKRNKKIDELEKALMLRDESLQTLQGLQQTMGAFDSAHAALVTYALSDKSPQDISDLITVVNRYSALASALINSFASS